VTYSLLKQTGDEMDIREIRKRARERVKEKCRVCPICDGRACAGDVPGMGGIGTGVSFQNNIKALAAKRLVMRVLHEANDPDTAVELWGRRLSMPVFVAPVGSVAANIGSDMADKDYLKSLLKGSLEAGTMAGVGDLPALENFLVSMSTLGENGRMAVPFIKPWQLPDVEKRLDLAKEHGCDICGMDVDAAGLTILRRAAAPVSAKTPGELGQIIKLAHDRGFKFIVKGIMAADEAKIAVDAGADAVLVSNHGGRVLDHSPGTAEVLPSIADAVGKYTIVMLDGGIRSGADVLKALALGAEVTLICRPVLVAVHGDEENGAAIYLNMIREELSQAMRLTGCANIASITGRVIC
jgi:hypothetical protein